MKISIGFDHGALNIRESIIDYLTSGGHQIIDHGTDSAVSVDYPDYAEKVARDVAEKRADLGVLCCTTGIGMSIAANKFHGVRAAVIHYEDEAILTRQHNHANILCMGGLHTTPYEAGRLLHAFLTSEPEGGRHDRRVGKIRIFEEAHSPL